MVRENNHGQSLVLRDRVPGGRAGRRGSGVWRCRGNGHGGRPTALLGRTGAFRGVGGRRLGPTTVKKRGLGRNGVQAGSRPKWRTS